jgi:flagellar biosynthesis anti-sigma factor FlgM
METRQGLAVQKTLMSEVEAGAEERTANHSEQGNKLAPHVHRQVISEEQLQVQYALKAIRYSPDVRAERVEALRARIESGTYQVDSVSLAMKLLGITERDAS